ncbi:FxSxx-COOH system tetratricopeptide repeat protein [Actinomadura craniellae]|nr:FxSxx-COOH system tetratricopeptide repeat protein [Actinomadura craniellae]
MVRARADNPSYRNLEKQAITRGQVMPRTTLGEVLNGRRFPSKIFLRTFLKLCGVDPDTDPRWEQTWNRIAVASHTMDGPPAGLEPRGAGAGYGPSGARPPGTLPRIWNVDPRNPEFAGRERLLDELHQRLGSTGHTVVQALRGMGGVGKTHLAIEYAHRFSDRYELVWWISAEDASLIGEQFSALAVQLGLAEVGADTVAVAGMLKAYLRGRGRWLLIFDNAEAVEAVREWLPGGPGHVLITSRAGGWERVASGLTVDVMDRWESVTLLRNHHGELTEPEADELAAALGDLPLALAQAGGFLAETGTSVTDYLRLLSDHPDAVMGVGATDGYPRPLAAAIALSTTRLGRDDAVGSAVVRLCAFLAPETVPVQWLISAPRAEGGPLGELSSAGGGPMAVLRGVGAVSRFGLAVVTREGIRLHRLTRGIIQDQLDRSDREAALEHARLLLVANRPGDPEAPVNWPQWAQLVPHLLAVEPAEGTSAELRRVSCDAAWYLIERGDAEASRRLADGAVRNWRETIGPDHPDTLLATRCLARAHREMGRYGEALGLYEATLPRYRGALGDDHPDTLRFAHGMAIALALLGRHEEARSLQADTLGRYRRVLGADHPHALHSANHLAVALRALGEIQEAIRLHQETWDSYRRVLGDDHPDTLRSAANLALDLRARGLLDRAHELQRQTLDERRRILGDDHLYTLQSARELAETLFLLGRAEEALALQRNALERARTTLGDDHPETQFAKRNIADIFNVIPSDKNLSGFEGGAEP